ncbi:transglutaminase-like domain-containing protein [Paenibacillus silvisoli]|uniref:transglutaminase-like domain-containing protein n=1 Tax=Paenibacillus silvisoli TaxID=3110539 RepID=UPI00280522FB|nr:transglutaminase family protein [Paenibacillus silvisoli]
MNLICQSQNLDDYLLESEAIDFSHPDIAALTAELQASSAVQVDFIKRAYEYVRDEIAHSWDIQSNRITCAASEALRHREGICYAKANLLSAVLRKAGIPAGFCYQRLTIGDTPDTGYCIHALNAVYLSDHGKWIRLDARGNKPGIDAAFSLTDERLAFPVREEYDEVDYSTIFISPNPKTTEALKQNSDCKTMYLHGLPENL